MKSGIDQGIYLKQLRKKLNLTQTDVGKEQFNKIKMSRFENGLSPISEEDAKILEININETIKNSKFEPINYLYFYNHEKFLIIEEAENNFKKLEHLIKYNLHSEFNIALEAFNNEFINHDIPDMKIKVFKMAAIFYTRHKEYHNSYLYYSRCVDNAMAANNYDEIIKGKINVYQILILLDREDEAIRLYKSLIEDNNLNSLHKYHIYNNMGHAYLKKKDYDNALQEFITANKYVDISNIYNVSNMYLQRAYCMRFLNYPLEAIKINEEGLAYIGDNLPIRRLTFVKNIISCYRYLDNKESMRNYMQKFVSYANDASIEEKNDAFVIEIYTDLYDDFMYLQDKDGALFYISRAFYLSNQQQNFHYQNATLKKMLEYYRIIDADNPESPNVMRLVGYITELLTKYPDKINNKNVVFTMLLHFFETNQRDVCLKLLNLMMEP